MLSASVLPAKRYKQDVCRESGRVRRGNDCFLLEMTLAQENRDDWLHAKIVVTTANAASLHGLYTLLSNSARYAKL
jgi:hypothetical protein